MLESKLGLIASKHIALQFSEEYLIGNNPIGGHKFYRDKLSLIPSYKCLSFNIDFKNNLLYYGLQHNIFNKSSEKIVLNYNFNNTLVNGIEWIAIIDKPIQWYQKKLYQLTNCLFIINISKYNIPNKITTIIPEYIIKYPKTQEDLKLFYDFILRKINKL
jgi:hypothetical protein